MAKTPPNRSSHRPQGRLIGYARVSTDEQATEAQEMELRSAGCDAIIQESGAPSTDQLMKTVRFWAEQEPDADGAGVEVDPEDAIDGDVFGRRHCGTAQKGRALHSTRSR